MLVSLQPAEAQQTKKVPTIGWLAAGSPSGVAPLTGAFRQGLRELGYVEGKNIAIEYRYAKGKFDRLPDLAAEIVHLKVDVIVVASTPAIQAVKQATATIPIVMVGLAIRLDSGSLPVSRGRVETLRGCPSFQQS